MPKTINANTPKIDASTTQQKTFVLNDLDRWMICTARVAMTEMHLDVRSLTWACVVTALWLIHGQQQQETQQQIVNPMYHKSPQKWCVVFTCVLWVARLACYFFKLTQVIFCLILTQAITILLLIYIFLMFKMQVSWKMIMWLCHLILRPPFCMVRYHVEQTNGGMPWEGVNTFSRMMIGWGVPIHYTAPTIIERNGTTTPVWIF